MTTATIPQRALSPAVRLEQINRFRQLLSGEVHIPLRCGRCIESSTLDSKDSDMGARCIKCGHGTGELRLHEQRVKHIVRFVRTGER